MTTTLELPRPEQAPETAAALLRAFPGRRVFLLDGPMGAGKTTLIKALCKVLGVEAGLASPSFAIVNEYRTPDGGPVYHFDLYRLENADELDGIGFGEYLDSGAFCFVEWPALGEGYYPPDAVRIHLAPDDEGKRTLTIEGPPAMAGHHA